MAASLPPPRVGLFVTCLVDLFRPLVGFAAVKLIREAGCEVEVPREQTCCGQPAYNSGDRGNAAALARQTVAAFEPFAYVVVPSGSCGGMIRQHYPELLGDDPVWAPRAQAVATKTYELFSFLTDIRGMSAVRATFRGTVTYHDSCSSLREMRVKDQPRRLLSSIDGLELRAMEETEVCCGFGGTFCVKYPDISNRMVEVKAARAIATGAETLVAGDLGCLLNIAGKLHRQGATMKARHAAEILAGMADDTPAIGDPT